MKRLRWIVLYIFTMAILVAASGCEPLRFAPGEAMKQNAWLHNRTAMLAADAAEDENTSQKLQELVLLSEMQSRAFMADYGMPRDLPAAGTAEEVLNNTNRQLAATALEQSHKRPDPWNAADGLIDIGIAAMGIIGGAYGLRIGGYLRQSRDKSKALREIIRGNERFKQTNIESAEAFKTAHKDQSLTTRQLVTAIK